MSFFSVISWSLKVILRFILFTAVRYLFTTLGFVIGLVAGLVGGYFLFIYKLPTEVEEMEVRKFSDPDAKPIEEEELKQIHLLLPPWVMNPDVERLNWLNTLLSEMWPYLNTAICAIVKEQVTPLLAQYKPAVLESLEFQELTLGSIPPAFSGIQVFETNDDEMIFQPKLRWAGNPNIVVEAKAKGIKATVQLVDFLMFLNVRITFKPLVPVFPCFSRIVVSFMEKPSVDFGLKAAGMDLMAIPGLYHYVQDTVKNIVAGMFLWPKVYEVYRGDPRPGVGWLFVRKISAKGLRNMGLTGTSDPYVHLSLGQHIGNKKTTVQDNNLNPTWTEEFQMKLIDPKTQKLTLEVYDKETGKRDKLMSVQQVALDDLVENEAKTYSLNLVATLESLSNPSVSKKDYGTINFELLFRKFTPEEAAMGALEEEVDEVEAFPAEVKVGGGRVRVILHSGMNLESKHHSNPFVRLRFRHEEVQSNVYKKSKDVEFDKETFEFLVDKPPKEEVLHVQVYSKNLSTISTLVSSKEVVGYCDIPLEDAVANRRINDIYSLTDSKQGKIKLEIQWHQKTSE